MFAHRLDLRPDTCQTTDQVLIDQLRQGLDCLRMGRAHDALGVFRSGLLAAQQAGSPDRLIGEFHARIGRTAAALGDADAAAECYGEALRLVPDFTDCWCDLGDLYVRVDRPRDAVRFYAQAMSLDATHWTSRIRLAQTLVTLEQNAVAQAMLPELAERCPADMSALKELGKLFATLGNTADARQLFERAIDLNAGDADCHYWRATLLQSEGDFAGSEAAYAAALALNPLILKPAVCARPAFRVLALHAPHAGNTPTEYLFEAPAYEINTVPIIRSASYDIERLRSGGDIVINLISDADQGSEVLPIAADLIDRLGLPTLNLPRRVAQTTRESTAALLEGLADVRVPKIHRFSAGTPVAGLLAAARTEFSLPVLARPAGTHGGDDFEKLATLDELADFAADHGASDLYLIDYADYRSADGHFRKYRFIFIEDEVFPYHLAIGNDWKVHHVNTDMARLQWMQEEEAEFLERPQTYFAPHHFAALKAIAGRFGLAYCGIDCGLDTDGNVLVFEVNASMLVHQKNEDMPYKIPHVVEIKRAFDAMLFRAAGRG
jgi:tetratricopeptide (TPR) repeat protein